ncbi:aminotransferase class I/II-fold pyridoxal phosphate-dependent enzyme [Pseudothermotoga thermarum]|uniref:histidinol-phosphate transaminase n=1 Tax=Pseudothermotoga thermarum DSM 5069 TaxID=688269 RepID=F7YVV3_9THEM|nr:aminotransferase class I/II-fold pyridoxal phosphate-dependent enzyme [Pseudothermotoga thermarum]AEH51775.1 aminotransferase class I and II [Pseudothermotoga thermarum DSM 5069]
MVIHGGIREKDFLDFSISVNPFVPEWFEDLSKLNEDLRRYTYIEWLEENFQNTFGNDTVIVAGAMEALHIIGWEFFKDSVVFIPVPNYYEYFRVASFSSFGIVKVPMVENCEYKVENFEKLLKLVEKYRKIGKRMCFITSNPNNPTGIFLDLSELLNTLVDKGVLCIIDEAFLDFVDEEKLRSFENNLKVSKQIIRLRTFTKSFGLPGVRVGYVKSAEYKNVFLSRRMPWAVGGTGYVFLEKLLANDWKDFLKRTKKYIKNEMKKFASFDFFKSDANYFMVKVKEIDKVLDFLRLHRISVRDARSFEIGDFIRIGIKDSQANDFLLEKLKEISNLLVMKEGG